MEPMTSIMCSVVAGIAAAAGPFGAPSQQAAPPTEPVFESPGFVTVTSDPSTSPNQDDSTDVPTFSPDPTPFVQSELTLEPDDTGTQSTDPTLGSNGGPTGAAQPAGASDDAPVGSGGLPAVPAPATIACISAALLVLYKRRH